MHTTKNELSVLKMLTARSDFLAVQRTGKKWISHGLIFQVRPNDLDEIRIGFTVSKKVDKRAVYRNRIKRRLRAVAADILTQHAQSGCDYILVGRTATAKRPYDTLCNDLKWCLKKTGYLKAGEKKP